MTTRPTTTAITRIRTALSAFGLVAALIGAAGPAMASDITPKGVKLGAALDALDVERLWPAGVHVDWRSGVPDGRVVKTEGKHTHCSAFVASAAERLGIYILRPPAHSPVLLANAQFEWLKGQGAASGWTRLPDGVAAQDAANRGDLVVASYRNANPKKPGHIAIVRPDAKPDDVVRAEGPQVTQAGNVNYRSTTLRLGFAGHGPALRDPDRVRFWAHASTFMH